VATLENTVLDRITNVIKNTGIVKAEMKMSRSKIMPVETL